MVDVWTDETIEMVESYQYACLVNLRLCGGREGWTSSLDGARRAIWSVEVCEDDKQYYAGVLRNSDFLHCSNKVFDVDRWSTGVVDDGGDGGDREDAGVRSCAAEAAIAEARGEVNRNYLILWI